MNQTLPNLSSIMFLVKLKTKEKYKTILFTGDGSGRQLLENLSEKGLLDSNENIHVDILKLPHHGSKENVFEEFFEQITADIIRNDCS